MCPVILIFAYSFFSSMNLINAMLTHVINDPRWEEFIHELERLNVRKAVIVRPRSFSPRPRH